MVSSYLERPIRTLEQALEEREQVWGELLELGPGTPTSPAVDPYDPFRVLIRPLANDHGTAADDPTPRGGRRAALPANRRRRIPAKRRWNEQPNFYREMRDRQAIERGENEGMIVCPP